MTTKFYTTADEAFDREIVAFLVNSGENPEHYDLAGAKELLILVEDGKYFADEGFAEALLEDHFLGEDPLTPKNFAEAVSAAKLSGTAGSIYVSNAPHQFGTPVKLAGVYVSTPEGAAESWSTLMELMNRFGTSRLVINASGHRWTYRTPADY